jgi:hypothetical protein
MFETVTTAGQAAIMRRAHQMRAETLAGMLRAFVALFRRRAGQTKAA